MSSEADAHQSKEEDGEPKTRSSKRLRSDNDVAPSFILFTCSYYVSTDDLRFQQCLETLQEVQNIASLQIVIVDGSPADDVLEALKKHSSSVIVSRQTSKGGKGVALREAAALASKLPGVADDTFLCWLEPEKTSMVALWSQALDNPACENADLMVPFRNEELFQKSYPIEQFHSETYGNFFLDAVMNQVIKANGATRSPRLGPNLEAERAKSEHLIPVIDWHFGPFCFKAKHIQLWTAYSGGSYDAQLVPIVHAMRKGLLVASVLVEFELDPKMKEQEQGNVEFIEKRLTQLSTLDPVVKNAWTDDFYC